MAEDEKKNPFAKYAKDNNVGGLRNVLLGDSIIRRIVWFVILLGLLAATGYTLRNNFKKLIYRPTSTTISTFTPTTQDFPAVTVCNLNLFSASVAIEADVPYAIPDLRQVLDGSNNTCYSLLQSYINLEDTDFLQLINVNPQNLISKCRFSGEDCNVIKDFEPVLTHLGVCFTFNSGKFGRPIKRVSNVGVRSGLQLELKVNQSDYIGTFAGDAGLKIAVHPQSEPPLPDELGIAVPPGNNAFISFRKRTVEDETGINCREAHEISDWNFLQLTRYNQSYSQAACLRDSFLTRVADKCKCIVTNLFIPQPTSGPYSQQPVCNFADICCNFEQYTTPVKVPCTPACNFDEYPVSTASYSLFPANYKLQSLSREDSASANIFFETMTVETQHTEFSYGFEEFFAEVGGQLGLFIGVDIICLFEFFFFLYDVIVYCAKCKPCKSFPRRANLTDIRSDDDFLME